MNICEPFRQTSGDIAKMWCQKHISLSLLSLSLSINIYQTLDNRFLKILVVIGHVCIYWSKVAEGFLVFNAVLLCIVPLGFFYGPEVMHYILMTQWKGLVSYLYM